MTEFRAVNRYVLSYTDVFEPIMIKVTDHKKGYWAEAPITAREVYGLLVFALRKTLDSGHESREWYLKMAEQLTYWAEWLREKAEKIKR